MIEMKIGVGAALALLLAACGDDVVVSSDPACGPADLDRLQAAFAVCVGNNAVRQVSVDDDTVDLAAFVRECGQQSRENVCPAVRVAERHGPGWIVVGHVRCDDPNLPTWAAAVCR